MSIACFVYVTSYLRRVSFVQEHVRPIRAGLVLCIGIVLLLAAVWSPPVAKGLGRFALSPGLGSLAALAAAALALYGVFRQLSAAAVRELRAEEVERASEYAKHFRWVSEQVLGSRAPEDIKVVEFLIEDLFNRALDERDEDAALALLEQHQARIKETTPVADADDVVIPSS